MSTTRAARWSLLVILFAALFASTPAARGQGIFLPGIGTVNRSMAGASTATPIESIGALHWNPGSVSALPQSEVSFAMELLLADVELTTPGGTVAGEAGAVPLPAVGWVHHIEDTNMTIGLGMYAVAGFRNNLPPDPALAAIGVASAAFADAEFLQIAPTISWALTDRLSFGIAPTITTGKLTFNPLPPAVGGGRPGSGNRVHWGGGLQAGLYYIGQNCWNYGISVKTPQWFETFRFFDAGAAGGVSEFALDLPLIISGGVSYAGLEDWIFALDVRYFDYENADGFGDILGWDSVYAINLGIQYRVNDCMYVRMGYTYSPSPIGGAGVVTNIFDPLIEDHQINVGVSYRFAHNVDLNLGYMHMVNTTKAFPPIPISHTLNVHSASMGVTVRY